MSGEMDAANVTDLEMRLKRMQMDLIVGKPARSALNFGKPRLPRRDLINFCFHLEQLTQAGVPIIEGLNDLRDAIKHPHFRQVVSSLIESIEGGQTLSQAMAAHPATFSPIFVNLIHAGEVSGQLPEILASLSDSLKWEDELAAHTKKLLIYPAIVGSLLLAATSFLMIYLVPQLKLFVRNMGQVLPMHTKLLFFLSEALSDHGYVFLLPPLLGFLSYQYILHFKPAARLRLDGIKLRLPVIGPILRKIILSRFANTFAMLYAAGIPVLTSINTTRQVIGNLLVQKALQEVEQNISRGSTISAAFAEIGLFPSLVIRMLRIGESTGKLDAALRNVSYFYNRDVKEAVAKAQALIEPALTTGLGLMLGWIMLAVIGPIYDVISTIKP